MNRQYTYKAIVVVADTITNWLIQQATLPIITDKWYRCCGKVGMSLCMPKSGVKPYNKNSNKQLDLTPLKYQMFAVVFPPECGCSLTVD